MKRKDQQPLRAPVMTRGGSAVVLLIAVGWLICGGAVVDAADLTVLNGLWEVYMQVTAFGEAAGTLWSAVVDPQANVTFMMAPDNVDMLVSLSFTNAMTGSTTSMSVPVSTGTAVVVTNDSSGNQIFNLAYLINDMPYLLGLLVPFN